MRAESNSSFRVGDWTDQLLARGRVAFSLQDLQSAMPNFNSVAMRRALDRLSEKGRILSIYKGYYLIITPPYAAKGILPPALFLDGLMKYLQRPYYLGLLNAAAFHGAAHQQPQEFFVVTTYPAMRPVQRQGLRINYLSKEAIPEKLIEPRKTESGYLFISSPELTATDLIQFEKRIGGITRAAAIIEELAEQMRPKLLRPSLLPGVPTAVFQRMGYLLEEVLGQPQLASELFLACKQESRTFYRVPLKASVREAGFPLNKEWNVVVNVKIEIEE